jgi:chromosome segregation ATPase
MTPAAGAAAAAALLGVLAALLAWSAKRELGRADHQAEGLEGRVRSLEQQHASLSATVGARDRRLDELIREMGDIRERLDELLQKRRGSEPPAGGLR